MTRSRDCGLEVHARTVDVAIFVLRETIRRAAIYSSGLRLSRNYFNSKFQPGRAYPAGQLARKQRVQPRLLLCGVVDIENDSGLLSNASRRMGVNRNSIAQVVQRQSSRASVELPGARSGNSGNQFYFAHYATQSGRRGSMDSNCKFGRYRAATTKVSFLPETSANPAAKFGRLGPTWVQMLPNSVQNRVL